MSNKIENAKRLVIKIGSSLLVDNSTSKIHVEWLNHFLDDIVFLAKSGKQIILVSSGAIQLGRRHLQFKHRELQLEERQAAAAVGQIQLAHIYQETLAKHGFTVAQILLTLDDSENRKRYLNAKNTLETLLDLHAIPVINENDTVAAPDTKFGDNDRLAARVAQMVSADTLVLLSDIDGLYNENPQLNPQAKLIPLVTQLTPDILAMGGDSQTAFGSGGMRTKLAAAKIAMASGCKMVIAAGKHFNPLQRIDNCSEKTWFIPDATPTKARKNWIAQHLKASGQVTIDAGAVKALLAGKSLLSVGITSVEGQFQKGDAIVVRDVNQQDLAKGLVNYSANETRKIIGKRSHEFEMLLGYHGSEELIHRDNLVIINQ